MDYLSVKEAAELKCVSVRAIQKNIAKGTLKAITQLNTQNKQECYMIPISSLPADLQAKYYSQRRQEAGLEPVKMEEKQSSSIVKKAFEDFSEAERDEITKWTCILQEWQSCREKFAKKTEADKLFLTKFKLENPDTPISMDILYRKYEAYKNGNLEGVLGKRGGANKGVSTIPEEVWDYFRYLYLSENKPTVSRCYELTVDWTKDFHPEMVTAIPHERSFRRHIKSDIPQAVLIYMRNGDKAMKDKCLPYIGRMYDNLHANDVWIADNHTLDIQSYDGNGIVHRLYLTAFLDAKSGVLVGWNICDSPNSQSTILALRHGIKRFGIPKTVYFDNGREFLVHDIGGKGHRTRKSDEDIIEPPTILQRLGIEMRNAIVRNAKAKPIERTFSTVTMQFSRMFEGYCGGTIMQRPESLKRRIKEGKIPCDYEIREFLNDWIDYDFNVQDYGGSESKFKGMSRIDVWNQDIRNVGARQAEERDLNLMLMRSTRIQKIKRDGVYITISDEKIWYMDYENTYKHLGEEVYVRYDPADLREVRIYDKDDRYLWTWGVADKLMQDYITDQVDELSDAMAIQRNVAKRIKADAKAIADGLSASQRIDLLDMSVRRTQRGKEQFKIELPTNIIPVRSNEPPAEQLKQAAGDEIIIDIARMNRNQEFKKKTEE
ncbi:MAG: Mu transposase C-terminal domain-containing protein [Oscillospiraceae bacterium]